MQSLLQILLMAVFLVPSVSAHLCPLGFPCPCEELEDKYGKILHVKCQRLNLTTVPDLVPLRHLKLHKLDLSDNLLTSLMDDTFFGLHFVQWYGYSTPELLLDRNPLNTISKHAFSGITAESLRLQLMETELAEFPREQIEKIVNVTGLSLGNNKIIRIPDRAFSNMKNVSYISLSGNNLEISQDLFGGLEDRLESVQLNQMALTSVPVEALKKLKALKSIDLSNNEIHSLPDYLFEDFETTAQYFTLEMRANNLEDVSLFTFHKNRTRLQIFKVVLDDNKITNIDFLRDPCGTVFRARHTTLHLINNPIQCDCGFYSILQTGYYSLYGQCHGPSNYTGMSFKVWTASRKSGEARFQTEYGQMAKRECQDALERWDILSCDNEQEPPSDAAATSSGDTARMLLIWGVLFVGLGWEQYQVN